jgi:hypothetical protein
MKVRSIALSTCIFLLIPTIVKAETISEFVKKNNFNTIVSDEAKVSSELNSIHKRKVEMTEEMARIKEMKERLQNYENQVNAYIDMAEEDRLEVDRYNEQLESRKLQVLDKKEKAFDEVMDIYSEANQITNTVMSSIETMPIKELKNKCRQVVVLKDTAYGMNQLINKIFTNEVAKEYSYNAEDVEKKYREQKEIYEGKKFVLKEEQKEIKKAEDKYSRANSYIKVKAPKDDFNIGSSDNIKVMFSGWKLNKDKLESNKKKNIPMIMNGLYSRSGYSSRYGKYIVFISGSTIKCMYYGLDTYSSFGEGSLVSQGETIGTSKSFGLLLFVNGTQKDLSNLLGGSNE